MRNRTSEFDAIASPRNDGASLPVLGQHLLARAAEVLAVLLQAGQDDLVALAYMSAAEARDVARAGIMFVHGLCE